MRTLLAFVVIPNALLYVLGLFFFTNRALFNLDYLALAMVWPWLMPWLHVAAFTLVFLLDGVTATGSMYNINPVAGLDALTRAPIGLILSVIAALLIATALGIGLARFAQYLFKAGTSRSMIVTAVVLALAIFLLDGILLGNRFIKRHTEFNKNIATSSAARFAWDLRERARSVRREVERVTAASDGLRADVAKGSALPEHIAVIIVESLGQPEDSVLRAFIQAPFNTPAIAARYTVRHGDVAFRGGTTSGELRELCGIFSDYITLPTAVMPACLPKRLRALGYETVSVHGYKSSYYNRGRWYPMLFDRMHFMDALEDAAADRRCGTQFRGVCDRDAFATFARELRAPGRRLVYWLTLDGHTPVDMAREGEFPQGCGSATLRAQAPDVCLIMAFQHDLMTRVAALAADSSLAPTRFLIVGDHAPAFVRRNRAGHFVPGRVPFVELVP